MISAERSCNLCGQKNFQVIEEDEKPFRVLRCGNCGLVFVDPLPEMGKLAAHYDPGYYEEWIKAQQKRRSRIWAERLRKLESYRSGGRLLDVGCGDGAFLLAAKQRGWSVEGTEISTYAAQRASDLLGVLVFNGELSAAPFPENEFDAVTLWHVLEHLADPMSCLLRVNRLLKPGGLVVIAVPNVNDLMMQAAYRIFKGRRLRLFSVHDREIHLYHFSATTLRAYLKKTGFDCLSLGPDMGMVGLPKRVVNLLSVIPYYLAGVSIFNALEVFAQSREGGTGE